MVVAGNQVAAGQPSVSPIAQAEQDRCQRPALFADRILHLGRDDGEDLALDKAILFELPELLDQKALRAVAKLSFFNALNRKVPLSRW